MFIANRRVTAALVALAAFTFITAGTPVFAANGVVDGQEAKCAGALGKGAAKVAKAIFSNTAKCRNAGTAPGSCPDAAALEKIEKAQLKFTSTAVKSCSSICSQFEIHGTKVPCIQDTACPPTATSHEQCSAGSKDIKMDIADIGLPGAFCEGAIGREVKLGIDLGECVGVLTEAPTADLINVTYGSIDTDSLSDDDAKCLASIAKAAQKYSDAIMKGVVKCRGAILSGSELGDPATCRFDQPAVLDKITDAQGKFEEAVDACAAAIPSLDLCNNGVGATPDATAAKACLVAAINEITDTTTLATERIYAPRSLVEAAYPPARGICGDGVANQLPNPFQLLGEECDVDDDSACPGDCLPPGDVYQCTCADRPLIRFFADGLTADLDSGWTGTSHDSGVADDAGYINEVGNCNCSALTGATCTGSTSDAVCDLIGFQLPTCTWDPLSTVSCDGHGNGNLINTDSDCGRCDLFNVNADDFCINESDCTGQCFDPDTELPVGTCETQVDCNTNFPGTICRGQCDTSGKCIIIPNGAPLPISSGGTPVCVLTTFRQNITGTRNIVTGEHAVNIQQFSKVHLGIGLSVPCPLCGGFCNGPGTYPNKGFVCQGTCSVTTSTQCRFDADCPLGETCTSASPQCPGQTCNLTLICGGGGGISPPPELQQPNYGKPCRLEAYTTDFGTTSNDCPPDSGKNISGAGLAINFLPSTSETVNLPATLNCSAPGYDNFKCPCPALTGLLTQPNDCAGACNAGAERGQGCGTGNGNITGELTTCAGGTNGGEACDEDADCPLSTCSVNPTHCTGGAPADELKPCATNGDCGGGGTCGNACPSGRCVQLCLQSDDVDAPVNTKNDPEEGLCAAGPPAYRCTGEHDTFRACTEAVAESSCSAVCAASCSGGGVPSGGSMAACSPNLPCGGGEICCGSCPVAQDCEAGDADTLLGNGDDIPGAGICAPAVKNCVVNESAAEGGDTLNGNGDATNVRSVSTYCIGSTGNSTVNNTAGLGGPGRLRQRGINVVNKNTIP